MADYLRDADGNLQRIKIVENLSPTLVRVMPYHHVLLGMLYRNLIPTIVEKSTIVHQEDTKNARQSHD
ncbi:MAG TPA: hypothetical protein H9875_06575 [Candidatus Levilactobacillus faecigallinarum]|uniref:Uncharacterized protein n=1 Tax=Candidatus Levilactobacillus faecigallinarum TaxID=2838638 RepID=A0A9D1QT15_9LACO|nr:hypothetical protein [Candidatus Levilactobacillus faecigallinarum]